MVNLPPYSSDATVGQITDSKARPPGYHEAASGSASGEVYRDKFNHGLATGDQQPQTQERCSHMTVHSTQTQNFVLLAPNGDVVYYVDNTSSLSKTIIRAGNSTASPVISISHPPGPFVKEMSTDYKSRVRSKVANTCVVGSGRFSIAWSFTVNDHTHVWKSHKGVWTLKWDERSLASYNVGRTFDIDSSVLDLSDVIISTLFTIELYSRLTNERRVRALNSVSGKSSSMIGTGLLL